MSDLQEIKNRLKDEDRIEELLEAMECEYIKTEQRGFLITAQLPERFYSSNKRAVQVKLNDSISCNIRNKPDFEGGDIFNLISYVVHDKRGSEVQDNLHNAKKFICKTFGWEEYLKGDRGDVVVKDYTASLKAIIGQKKRRREYKPNPVLPEKILQEFYFWGKPLPDKGWVKEGISRKTQNFYGVGFDLDSKRITFPLRNRFGQLVGVKGRIFKDEDDPEKKYMYIYRCNNRYEWFNLWNAHPYILMEKRVYVYEAEKSCMKAFENGIYNTVAIGASEISDEQIEIIKQLGLDIEIVLCYDKGIDRDEVQKTAVRFEDRDVYEMYDIEDVLEGKNSPIDQGVETWEYLVENCIFRVNTDEIEE